MADGISMETSELRALSADLVAAGSGIADKVRPVIHKGAGKIKAQMRAEMSASRHFAQVAGTIDYDMGGSAGRMASGSGVIEAVIGPDRAKTYGRGQHRTPGNLANIAYFGTSRGGGTVPDPRLALEAEQPHFEAALMSVLGDLL